MFHCLLLLLVTNIFALTPKERLANLVNVNSGSENVVGVNVVQAEVRDWLNELGFTVDLIPNPNEEVTSGKLLLATMKGESQNYITFITHADTIFEPTSPFQKLEETISETVKGPGSIDSKGGMVVGYLGLKEYLTKFPKPKYSLRIVITPNEELASVGFEKLLEEWGKDSWMVLGLQAALDGSIIHSRKGNRWIEVEVLGKEAHAGSNHKDGVNACKILSEKLIELSKLTDYSKEITVSVGRIEGGQDKFNIVCGTAKAKIDTRTPSMAKREELNKKIEKILKHPNITYKVVKENHPFSMDNATKKYIDKYLKAIKDVEGGKPQAKVSGAAGDANRLSHPGLIIIDGLGPKGSGLHTLEETVEISSIESRAKALALFLSEL